MLSRTELESLTVTSALGGRMTRGFEMAGFLSRNDLVALLAGAVRTTVIPGGAPGNLTVTGIAIGDALRAVLSLDVAQTDHPVHLHDLLLEVVADDVANRINSALGPPVTLGRPAAGGTVVGVQATRGVQNNAATQAHTRTWAVANLTAEFTITAPDTINNAGGTNTTGRALIVVYEDLTP